MRITPFTFESLTGEEPTRPLMASFAPNQLPSQEEAKDKAPPPPPTFNEEELDQAKQQAHDDGFIEGKKEGIREAEKAQQEKLDEVKLIVERVEGQIAALQQSIDAQMQEQKNGLAKLVMACAQRVAGEALLKEPSADILEMIDSCMAGLFDAPQLTAKLHPDTAKAVDNHLPKGVSTVEDTNLNPADCVLEWQHGKAVRDTDSLWKEMDEKIQHYFNPQIEEHLSQSSNTTSSRPEAQSAEVESSPDAEQQNQNPANE